jgi:hypothetical protein
MSKFEDVRIEYKVRNNPQTNMPLYEFFVYTPADEYTKISGHRFVNLIQDDGFFTNDLNILLGFLRKQPPVDSPYIQCGNILEQPVIDFASEIYGLKDISTFSFEDLENGNEDFHFIRDLEYTNEEGERVTGEIKTFYNKNKLSGWENIIPDPHPSWWLQTRLEVEILKPVGGKGKIFYYYVDKPTMTAILKERPYTLKPQHLFSSGYIVKHAEGEPEKYIEENFGYLGVKSFKDLMALAKKRRDKILTRYVDDNGEFFYHVQVPILYPWYHKSNHVKKYIEEISQHIKIEEK